MSSILVSCSFRHPAQHAGGAKNPVRVCKPARNRTIGKEGDSGNRLLVGATKNEHLRAFTRYTHGFSGKDKRPPATEPGHAPTRLHFRTGRYFQMKFETGTQTGTGTEFPTLNPQPVRDRHKILGRHGEDHRSNIGIRRTSDGRVPAWKRKEFGTGTICRHRAVTGTGVRP